ncbi:hypothetical protein JCM10295v2_003328 [Rhodotorula toruloides]
MIYKCVTAQHGGDVSTDESDEEIGAAVDEAYAYRAAGKDVDGDVQVEELDEDIHEEEQQACQPTPGPLAGGAVVKSKDKGKAKVMLEPYIDVPSISRPKSPAAHKKGRRDDNGRSGILRLHEDEIVVKDVEARQFVARHWLVDRQDVRTRACCNWLVLTA